MAFTFEESTHTYRLDGNILPSVSKILEPLSGAEYANIPSSILMTAANRGTEIHRAIEDFIIFGERGIPEEYRGYFDAFEAWYSTAKPKIIATELQMYHPILLYAGTSDLVCQIGDDICLVDYKSSSKVIDKVYRVQMEAYKQLLKCRNINITRKILLHLKGAGYYEEVYYQTDDTEAWRVFGALRTVYAYKNS